MQTKTQEDRSHYRPGDELEALLTSAVVLTGCRERLSLGGTLLRGQQQHKTKYLNTCNYRKDVQYQCAHIDTPTYIY